MPLVNQKALGFVLGKDWMVNYNTTTERPHEFFDHATTREVFMKVGSTEDLVNFATSIEMVNQKIIGRIWLANGRLGKDRDNAWA